MINAQLVMQMTIPALYVTIDIVQNVQVSELPHVSSAIQTLQKLMRFLALVSAKLQRVAYQIMRQRLVILAMEVVTNVLSQYLKVRRTAICTVQSVLLQHMEEQCLQEKCIAWMYARLHMSLVSVHAIVH
jgi:hypothetical protein